MNAEQQKALEAADVRAFGEWEDGEGAECATTSGVWFAALAYERARVAALNNQPLIVNGGRVAKAGDIVIITDWRSALNGKLAHLIAYVPKTTKLPGQWMAIFFDDQQNRKKVFLDDGQFKFTS